MADLLGGSGDVSRAELTKTVREALGDPAAEVVDRQSRLLAGGYSGSSVYRLSGTARQGGTVTPWSVILKILRPEGKGRSPTSIDYWRREVDVWRSGFLDTLPPHLAAPRHLGVVEASDEVRLWLEDLPGPSGRHWPVERLALAARHLGIWQGAYLAGQAMSSYPWLAGDVVSQWSASFGQIKPALLQKRDDPFLRRSWPGDVYDRALALWADRPGLLAAIDRVPKVMSHGDYQPGNLFSRRGSQGQELTVAIDWSAAGLAPVGRELSSLFALAAMYFGVEPSWLPSFEALVYAAYLQGLRDSGWQGDERVVRFAHTASLGMFGGLHPFAVEPVGDEQQARIENLFELPCELVIERNTQLRRFCLDLADEARALLPMI